MSTPVAFMSTHMAPKAMQSSTNRPPDGMHGIGHGLEVVVRQDHAGEGFHMRGEHQSGFSRAMVATTSSMGAGAQGLCGSFTHAASLQERCDWPESAPCRRSASSGS